MSSYTAPPPQNQQPSKYPAQNYSQGASSPTNPSPYGAPPPAKRQRLSPDARSPTVNGSYGAPPSGYGNPYAPPSAGQQTQYSPQHYPSGQAQPYPNNNFNAPDPYPGNRQTWQQSSQTQPYAAQQRAQNAASPSTSQMMPPPPKPNREEREEKVGVDDINDALFSSGINLKDEENYMHNMYTNRHAASESFTSQQASSFGSTTASQSGSFHLLTQGTSFSSQPNGAGAGTLGATVTEADIENELKHKRTAAARKKAELDQHQLKNPFLLGNVMRLRLEKISREQSVRISSDGLYVLKPETKVMTNAGHTDGVAEVKAASCVDQNSPLVDILSLLSLASGERARGLLEESYSLARARRYGDHGRVPIEFKDVAVADGEPVVDEIVPESITETPWDQLPDGSTAKPQTTISFQSAVNNELRALAKRDQDAETARIKKREARRKAAEAASANPDEAAIDSPSILDTAATAASTPAADATGTPQPAKITKKELARQQKEKASFTEAQAATSTNQTAAMMALGRKGNKYSWMSGGTSSMPSNRFAKPTPASSAPGSGVGTPSRKDGARTPVGGKKESNGETAAGMTWGAWRENNSGGRGIQVRDWLLVLERDGRQKQAWERAALRLNGPAIPEPSKTN